MNCALNSINLSSFENTCFPPHLRKSSAPRRCTVCPLHFPAKHTLQSYTRMRMCASTEEHRATEQNSNAFWVFKSLYNLTPTTFFVLPTTNHFSNQNSLLGNTPSTFLANSTRLAASSSLLIVSVLCTLLGADALTSCTNTLVHGCSRLCNRGENIHTAQTALCK